MKRSWGLSSVAVSLLLLLFGVYLLATSNSRLPQVEALLHVPFSEAQATTPLVVDESSFDWVYVWDTPQRQHSESGLTYDLFTPPTLWRDEVSQQLVLSIPQPVLNAQDWGMKLVSLDRQWYRVQFEGSADSVSLGQSKVKLYFSDAARGGRAVGYVGSRIPKLGVRVLAFDPNARGSHELKRGTTVPKNPEVVILDELTGEEITLRQKDVQYTNRWVAHVSLQDTGDLYFNEVGESHVRGNSRIRVEAINFEKGSVTLQREDLTTGKMEYAVLSQ